MERRGGNANPGRLMRIGDLARRAGTTMRTIRYYEQLGLINPAGRTKGGFRLYKDDELQRLHLIKNLRHVESSLAQVKALFDQRRQGRVASEMAGDVTRALKQQLEAVRRRTRQLQAIEHSLRETIEILGCCSECSLVPGPEVCFECPAIAGRDDIPLHMRALIESVEGGSRPPLQADREHRAPRDSPHGGEKSGSP